MVQRSDRYASSSSHRYRQRGTDRKVGRHYDHGAACANADADADANASTDADANASTDADASTDTNTKHCAIQRGELFKGRKRSKYQHHRDPERRYFTSVDGGLPHGQ